MVSTNMAGPADAEGPRPAAPPLLSATSPAEPALAAAVEAVAAATERVMMLERRKLLFGGAGLCLSAALQGCQTAGEGLANASQNAGAPGPATSPALRKTAVYVPGYEPKAARADSDFVRRNKSFARNIANPNKPHRILSRIGMDGRVTQAFLPAWAHDVKISPDRTVGILCGFEEQDHVAFDPETLDLVATAPAFGPGWRGGGHAAFLDRKTALLSERAPRSSLRGGRLENHYGRITIRDAGSLRIRDSYSSHGIDPHDIRLIDGGKYLVAANYGSLPRAGEKDLAVPRDVEEAAVTIIDMANGKLVDKIATGDPHAELRHLAAGRLDRIFAIQALLRGDPSGGQTYWLEAMAGETDITSEPGIIYMPAATLKVARGQPARPMGGWLATQQMRHGLSIVYDERTDQAIATYPSSHRVMVFDGASGDILQNVDTRPLGLRYPCGVTFLPDGRHYAIAGYWENLFVFERGTHRLNRELCLYPTFFGHSHITAA